MSLLSAFVVLPALLAGCAVLAHGLAGQPAENQRLARARPSGPRRRGGDAGMSTAEYAVGTVAAVAFAGVLYAVVSSSATRDLVTSIVHRALTLPF